MTEEPTRPIDREKLLGLLSTSAGRPVFRRIPPKRLLRCDRQPLRYPHTLPRKPPPKLPIVALSFVIALGIGASILVAMR